MTKQHRTIHLFYESLEHVIEGDFSHKIPESRYKMLNGLIAKYNQVLEMLAQNKKKQVDFEQSLLEARKTAEMASISKSQFLANMSHEIRTPINGIIGIARMLEDSSLNPAQKENVEILIDSANFLHGVINDILDLSKIEAGKLQIENAFFQMDEVISLVRNTIQYTAQRKKINIEIENNFQSENFIVGDSLRLRQVLINLMSNAVKFTGNGGKVSLKVNVLSQTEKNVFFRFEVTDTGIGLSDENQRKLFQPFQQADASTTRKFGGTGLGLSICKKLVELMGGTIGVTSVVGQGSTFWLEVAIEIGPSMENIIPQVGASADDIIEISKSKGQPIHALMAEDHPINQIVMKALLEKYSLVVDVVDTGVKAIEAVRTGKYRIVFMDCQMPEMDGYEATRHIRNLSDQQLARIPIIALTANAMTGDKELCLQAGMNGFVGKPVDRGQLEEELRTWLKVS